MKIRLTRCLLIALACGMTLTAASTVSALSVDEIILLVKMEIPDKQIVRKIDKDGSVFRLEPSEILKLKKKGVSDTIIRYMLGTASRKKGSSSGGATVKKVEAPKKPVRELTAAEQAAEEARMKEEALRLAEEQRRREEAQRKAFAGKVLTNGQKLAARGRWVEAVQVFTKFVNDGVGGIPFAPDSDEAYIATYGIANALARAGLLQSAANKLLEVVRAGPEKLFFQAAFGQLRDLRRSINYRSTDFEALKEFSVVGKDKTFQNSFHYFVGEFLHDFGLFADALPYLEKVDTGSKDYPRAQYLLGLIAFRDSTLSTATKVRRAVNAFQNAVVAGEETKNQGMIDLSYLALARLAYEYRQYDAAIYYYRKVSKNSPKIARAFYESGWAYFLKNDISRALGIFHALHSPYFKHHFYPELWILEATIYVNTCNVDRAKAAIKRFKEDVLVLGPPLRDFLSRHVRAEQLYEGVVKSINKPQLSVMPRRLLSPVLQNVEFYNLHKAINQIAREESKIRGKLTKLGAFGQELLGKLGQLKADRIAQAGMVVSGALKQVQRDINSYQDRLDELTIDLQEKELDRLNRKIEQVEQKKRGGKLVESGGSQSIAGSDSMVWPFEGEFWKDEINSYRSSLKSQCTEDQQ
ncbi:MAG: hypothetical protein CMH53_04955 [Myxococcales bacterium]|nr:hypothetical protein [Myxococcales bacterium]